MQNIMCKIYKSTILRANERMKRRPSSDFRSSHSSKDGMVISARFGGTEYIRQISMNEIRHSYANALMTTKGK